MPYQIIYSKCFLSAGIYINTMQRREAGAVLSNGKTENINVKTKK